jgi:hypothetical protein
MYDHGHAVFADGHEVEFGWSGWPAALLSADDTPETRDERQAQRLAYAEQVARDRAGAGYETMEIVRIWLAG